MPKDDIDQLYKKLRQDALEHCKDKDKCSGYPKNCACIIYEAQVMKKDPLYRQATAALHATNKLFAKKMLDDKKAVK